MATAVAEASGIVRIPRGMVLVPEEEYEKMARAQRNEAYRLKLEHSIAQAERGEVVVKSMEELEAMADE